MRRPVTIDLAANPLTLFLSSGLRPGSAPVPRQSRSEQRDEAPKTKSSPRSAEELPAPSQCARPDILRFFADFEEFRGDGHVVGPMEVHGAILDALQSAKQRPKDAQRCIPEDFRKIIDQRCALPEPQWALVDAALYLGKCCFKERTVAGAQISFQPADLKDTKFRKAMILMAISGIRDIGPWLLQQKKVEEKPRELELERERERAKIPLRPKSMFRSLFSREKRDHERPRSSTAQGLRPSNLPTPSRPNSRKEQEEPVSRRLGYLSSFGAAMGGVSGWH